jgi:predicted nucleic acid-binding Zn ribbon protein
MAKIDAKQVRIYKFNTFDCFTEKENKIEELNSIIDEKNAEIIKQNKSIKKKDEKTEKIEKNNLSVEIATFTGQRVVKQNRLYLMDNKGNYVFDDNGNKQENTWKQIAVFESDIIRLALGDAEADMQLVKEIIILEVHKHHIEILKQIISKGIKIDGEDFILYTATSGQVRDYEVTLIQKQFYENNSDCLMVGLTTETINKIGINIGKYLSYIALSLSSSVPLENEIDIDRCIVVKGLETKITDKVKFIDINDDLCIADTPKDYVTKTVTIEHTDGAGIFLPDEQKSSFQIRSGHFKGAMFPFDFKKYAEEVAKNTVIKDVWGHEHDVIGENIAYIFTSSQFKMWKYYKDWDEYKNHFKAQGIKFSVNSWANPAKDKVRGNYQVFQTLPPDSEIEKLCSHTLERLIKLHTDINFVKAEMKLDTASPKHHLATALEIYPQLIYDNYIQKQIKNLYKSELHKAYAGKILIDGYYSYAAPDMYAFCQFLFNDDKDPQGLIPKGCIYNKHYSKNTSLNTMCLLRSPHLTKYEHPHRTLIKTDDCNEWFKYMESDTVVSCHDLISKSLQMDWDGDEVLITPDAELLRLSVDTPPLYYKMQEAGTNRISDDKIFEALYNGFENNLIGTISNAITKLWNTGSKTLNDDLINVLCAYSNYSIDFPKTGKNIKLGDYKADYDKLTATKGGMQLPNFFIDAKKKSSKSVAKINNSVVNRIKAYIRKETKGLKYEYFKDEKANEFNYKMLMNNAPKHKVNRYGAKYNELRLLLKNLKRLRKDYDLRINETVTKKNTDSKEIVLHYNLFNYVCVKKIMELFENDVITAVNYLIDLEYFNSAVKEYIDSRIILWEIFGHIVINNIKANIESECDIKSSPRKGYIKALWGSVEADDKITEINTEIVNRKVKINLIDYEYFTQKLSAFKPNKYEREILFTLICIYKTAIKKDGCMTIHKNKHYIVKQNGKVKQKTHAVYNFNKIKQFAGADKYSVSLKDFCKKFNISFSEDEKRCYVNLSMPNNGYGIQFIVHDLFRPVVYLTAYETNKPYNVCVWCGKDYNKIGNKRTCSEKCAENNERRTTRKYNNKIKISPTKSDENTA